jgi:hypothetical protein
MPPLLRMEIEHQRDLNLILTDEIGREVGEVPGRTTVEIVKFYGCLGYKPWTWEQTLGRM